jgi:BirA family biotin operon repressor/biotin-[acetyl-CoA-carboxylase] ligase
MLVIKVNATDSTNLHMKRLMAKTELQDLTVLVAGSQNSGRGQAGTTWISEPGKNLTLSVLKYHTERNAANGFLISKAVSLALIEVLRNSEIPELSIKWPNDIMSGRRKICGILIENSIKGNQLSHSIIGIGINVNQKSFQGLPHAASLLQISGKAFDLDVLQDQLLLVLEKYLRGLNGPLAAKINEEYEEFLFLKDIRACFRIDGKTVYATIRGTTPEGEILLEDKGGQQRPYGLKQIGYVL